MSGFGALQPRKLKYTVGTRVELHPATDAWMQGDRYGEIVKVGRKFYTVKMDRSGRRLLVSPENLFLLGLP